MSKISPFLWYMKDAEEAARIYVSIFPNSSVDSVSTMNADSPSGPPGSVTIVEFTLFGQSFRAMGTAGPDTFNHAVSFYVDCEDQAEVDRYWDALLEGGGHPEQCGWLRDRYGVAWQIIPKALTRLMSTPDKAANKRASEAMMTMVKIDVAAIEAAARG